MMNDYVMQSVARQRMDETARRAETAHLRRGFRRTPARRHFPRVQWHLPGHVRVVGAWR